MTYPQPEPVERTDVMPGRLRIGTWNLQGRWDERHLGLLDAMSCDVLLLTEVSERVSIPGLHAHHSETPMMPKRHWASVFSCQPLHALPAPHGASAMAEVDGNTFCSSILPWRGCGSRDPWTGTSTAERTAHAVKAIEAVGPTVWGGDWNHAMSGREYAGSIAGRAEILATVDRLGLHVPTADLPHRIDGLLSIDHIAVPNPWQVVDVSPFVATVAERRISDDDAYVVEVVPARASP